MTQWKTIDDIPEDGEYLCLGHGGKYFICHHQNGCWWRQSFSKRIVGITHWMKLPDFPERTNSSSL